ncbi:MAG: hypothetical protein E6J75_09965 [Deltaproteobacteria bacterium]|nr:MAG: hypothetical protein E6J75_09965 [Deltaproteobacteria bacterium]
MRRSSVFVLALTLGTSLHHPAASRAAVGQKLPGCTRWQSRLQQLEQSGEDPASRRLRVLRNRIADGCVALNEIQVLGTHNSYHVQPRPALLAALLQIAPAFDAWEYTHPPLGEQFSNEGIRQIELDVWADPHGGLFARRGGLTFINEDPNSGLPELQQPGFKVLHIQDLDFETTCLTFVDCLRNIKAWSDAHRGHPLDAEILSVFPRHRLITPDDVRRGRASLEEAVLTLGWPRLGLARGKVLFTFDNGGAIRDAYLAGHPSLAGRILFTDSTPGEDSAAFVKANDPFTTSPSIAELVAAGYLVRTRADSDTVEARSGDTAPRDAAIASGAQYVSTDYPVENPAFGTGYVVRIPNGMPARCNPVNAPASCREAGLERLR